MFYKSNILILVFENDRRKIVIWDEEQKVDKLEVMMKEPVKNLIARQDFLCVATHWKTYVFKLWSLELRYCVETGANPDGLMALAIAEPCAHKLLVTYN